MDTQRIDFISSALAPAGEADDEARAQYMRHVAQQTPLSREAYPSDIARMAAFLASSESDHMTGLSISVSGGTLMD